MRTISLFLLLLVACQSLAQSPVVEVEQISGAIVAESVKVEPMPNGVLVLLTKQQPGTQSGAWLKITSPSKWATPYAEGVTLGQATDGRWYMLAKPGAYRVLVIEFDPEKGPRITSHEVKIGSGGGPAQPPPPTTDLAQLTKVAKDAADALADVATRKALRTAYLAALELMPGKTYEECRTIAMQARFGALNARTGASRQKDWASWLAAVDAVLTPLVKPGDADGYRSAIAAIAKGLE